MSSKEDCTARRTMLKEVKHTHTWIKSVLTSVIKETMKQTETEKLDIVHLNNIMCEERRKTHILVHWHQKVFPPPPQYNEGWTLSSHCWEKESRRGWKCLWEEAEAQRGWLMSQAHEEIISRLAEEEISSSRPIQIPEIVWSDDCWCSQNALLSLDFLSNRTSASELLTVSVRTGRYL